MPKLKTEPVLALNLFDLDRMEPSMRSSLLGGKLDLSRPIRLGKADEVAVGLVCSTLTAALAIDVIRSEDRRFGDEPTRAYLHRGGTWERLDPSAVLTVLQGETPRLNPIFFSRVLEAAPVKSVMLGSEV